jgi:uncharacterized protein
VIPSREECRQLMEEYQMLDNIKAHSIVVARISEFLAVNLVDKGFDISVDLIISAALLHDIGKTLCINNNGDHALKGKEICLKHGYHEIAGIVEEHVILQQAFPDQVISATEIVYYSDKRVNHDQIVSLGDRLDYILEVYGLSQDNRIKAIKKNFEHCCLIEEEIFSHLDCLPANLAEKVTLHNGKVYDFFS